MSIAERTDRKEIARISSELQASQRQRAWFLKSRIMIANRLQATIAGTIGYHSGMEDKDRQKKMKEADMLIKGITKGEIASDNFTLVTTTNLAIDGFNVEKKNLEDEMLALVKQLPVAAWVLAPEQRGFGLGFLGIVIGETGDLYNYANPAKVWRRFGCAPFTKDGETLMGATWRPRSKKKNINKLHAADWEEFGYSPRRRSIAYLIGEGLMKQNGAQPETANHSALPCGPYRKRYDYKKQDFADKHPEMAEQKGFKLHCHLHGMLLASKLLLKKLWFEWREDIEWEDYKD